MRGMTSSVYLVLSETGILQGSLAESAGAKPDLPTNHQGETHKRSVVRQSRILFNCIRQKLINAEIEGEKPGMGQGDARNKGQ